MRQREPSVRTSEGATLILIAEDEEPIAEALKLIIEDCGFQPLVASNGKQALEFACEHRPALILTDLMMPQMTGAQVIAGVRQDAAGRGYQVPPIVLISAAGRHFTENVGADVVLRKPFDIGDIEEVITRFLPLTGSAE